MKTKEFVKLVKDKFEVLPTKQELKKFMLDNDLDINKSVDEIIPLLTTAYITKDYTYITKEKILSLISKGFNHKEIAKKLHVCANTLTKLKKEYGIKNRNRSKKFKIDIEVLRELLKTKNNSQAAKSLGVSTSIVCRLAKKHGLVVDKKEIMKVKAIELTKQGYSGKYITKQLGISYKTFIKYKKEWNLKRFEVVKEKPIRMNLMQHKSAWNELKKIADHNLLNKMREVEKLVV